MPGKVNPVIPEVVTQVAAQVIGNDAAITIGGMQGHFELNVFVPMMARNLLDSIQLLVDARAACFAEKCVDGIEANREQCERYAELTLSAATALNPLHRLRQGERDREGGRLERPVAARGRARGGRRRRRSSTRRSTTARWRSRTADRAARGSSSRSGPRVRARRASARGPAVRAEDLSYVRREPGEALGSASACRRGPGQGSQGLATEDAIAANRRRLVAHAKGEATVEIERDKASHCCVRGSSAALVAIVGGPAGAPSRASRRRR